MAQYGTLDKPQFHGMVSCGDIMGGFALAFTALLGVYQQRTTGYGGEGRTSLARVIDYVQLPYMIATADGRSDWGEARGQYALGEHAWQRLYACSDRWIYVGTSEYRKSELIEAVVGTKSADEQSLEKAFAEHDCAYWLAKLDKADIACHEVISVNDMCERRMISVSNKAADEVAESASQVACWTDHPSGIPQVFLPSDHVRVGENHSYFRPHVAPRLGENTQEILIELRYTETEIAELIRLMVVHEYLPALGKKDAYFFA